MELLIQDAELAEVSKRRTRGAQKWPGIVAVLQRLKPGQIARVPLRGDPRAPEERSDVRSMLGTAMMERRWRKVPVVAYTDYEDGRWWLYLEIEEG